ncbi:MAG: phosphatidate cytidylyltransferase [Ardenticatenales bacterium]|nr:phosphatidate cytidylyltransferase [Ardenticatenales bacterium]
MSNLTVRILSAAVLIPLVLASVVWASPIQWRIGMSLVALVAAGEILTLAHRAGTDVERAVGAVGTYALVWGATQRTYAPFTHEYSESVLAVLGILTVLIGGAFFDQLRRGPDRRSVAAWSLTLAVPIYIGTFATFLVVLRGLTDGVAWTATLLALVWANDTAAYFGGRTFGRHPMAPALSPKKTWEGLAVGTAITVVVALGLAWYAATNALSHWVPSDLTTAPMWVVAALGLAVSIAGPLGDLSHSFIKRQFGAKDSSNVIPGHGGVWDRIDSLLFAAPVVYLFARLLGA